MDIRSFLNKIAMTAALVVGASFVGADRAAAATVPIGGVKTEVEVTADLAGLGLTATPFGSATAAGAVFTFPITGGTIDTHTGALNIRHDGSGVALSAGPKSAFVGNFVIDAAPDLAGTVFGSAAAFGFGALDDVPLFELAGLKSLGVELKITSALAGVLTGYFAAPDLTGAVFGYARPEVAPVPLPAAAFLMLGGMAALGAVGLRRKRAAA